MHIVYKDRIDAGKHLAKSLQEFHGTNTLVLGIPRGGVPVAATIAHRLELEWNVIVTRKLPVPWNPEAGFGAIAADGSMVLNEAMVHGLQLSRSRIDKVAEETRAEVLRRTEFFTRERPPTPVTGKTVIVVDDGLASGYTMLAAIKALRKQSASQIIAAAPVASRSAAALIEQEADKCVFGVVSSSVPFAVADFYVEWHDLTDADLLPYLRTHEEPHRSA